MKNKILALLATIGLASSVTAVEINENLSINGFIDASYTHSDRESTAGEQQELGLDEIELNFLFNNGPVSGAIHIDDYDANDEIDGADNDGNPNASYTDNAQIDIEQAHITYSLDNGVSFTIGKYGSALGFEREDPAGLYTYSRAYSSSAFNLGDVDSNVVEGLTVAYANDTFSIGASLENGADADIDTDNLNLELALSYTGFENITIGGGYYFDNQDSNNNNAETDVLNIHVSTNVGKLFLAAEYTELDRNDGVSDDGYLLLADYTVNDKIGVALRISSNETELVSRNPGAAAAGTYADYDKVTIAPRYAITDNLGAILEYSDADLGDDDEDLLAIELTYTF
jgi:hypothetical protein